MMKMKNFKNALINFNNASLLMEERIAPYLKRSLCYNEMLQTEKAVEEVKQAVGIIEI